MSDILILTNNFFGLQKFRSEVVEALLSNGFHVIISGPDYENSYPLKKMGCLTINSFFNRRSKNPFKDLSLCLHYIDIIKRYRPTVVLTYTIKPNIYGGIACRLTHSKQIANITGLGDAIENGGVLSFFLVTLLKIGLKKAYRVVFQNSSNHLFCKHKGIAKYNSVLLPGSGVNLIYHSLQPYPKELCTRFLFIGRIKKDKGIVELLTAAKNLKRSYGNSVEIQVLGDIEDDFSNEIKTFVNKGFITYLGSTSDVRPYLGHASCLVHPSYHEGLSNVCLEASAAGRPVITTNVPGCKETITDGLTGYLIKPMDVDDLTRRMNQFIKLPLEKKIAMGLAARQKVEKEFNRQIIVDWYIQTVLNLNEQYK